MWPCCVKMPTKNLLRLLLLLMLMRRNVLTIVWCRFGSWSLVRKSNFCLDFERKIWSIFWSWSSGEILKLKFSHYFTADPWFRFWKLFLVETLRLWLNFKFSRNADIGWGFEVAAWSRLWRWNLFKELVTWPKEVILVIRTQPSGPLCLWQCKSETKGVNQKSEPEFFSGRPKFTQKALGVKAC